MLKIKQLQILDKNNRMLCIDGHRIENFPLQGGRRRGNIGKSIEKLEPTW